MIGLSHRGRGIGYEIIILCLVFFFSNNSYSQNAEEITKLIYNIEELEISDEEKQTYIEDLIHISLNPININNAEPYYLRLLGLSEFQILSLQRYIIEAHPLLSIYEIPLINGFSEEDMLRIKPFIIIAPINWKPSLRIDSLFKKAYHDIRLQYKKVLEEAYGYTRNDGKGYLGQNFSTSLRYNLNYFDRLSFSLIGEKDAGESFFTNNQTYDFLSSQLTLKDISIFKQITLGDYKLSFGQGLGMNQNLNFGHFSSDARMDKGYKGIKPSRSTTEYNYMRGIATQIKISDFNIYLFASSKRIDYSGSILTTGLHRTESEVSKKDSNRENVLGANITWLKRGLEIGLTGFHYNYLYPITHQNSEYMKYYFTGKENSVISLNSTIPLLKKAKLLTEIAMSQNKGRAFLFGVEVNFGYKTNLIISYRDYQNQFQNHFSSTIGAQSRTANERGVYIGYSYLHNNKLDMFIAGDFFRFPDISYLANQPINGYKLRGEINYKLNFKNQFSLIAKLNNRPKNQTHIDQTISPEDNILAQIQLRYNYEPTTWIKLRTRTGYSNTKEYNTDTNQGFFLSQDILFKLFEDKIGINLRFAYFNTNDYDNRFSIYEYTLPMNFYTSQLYDRGLRTYILVNYKPRRDIEISAKYSLLRYFDKKTIHTYNDEIPFPHKQEISFQLHWIINKYRKTQRLF